MPQSLIILHHNPTTVDVDPNQSSEHILTSLVTKDRHVTDYCLSPKGGKINQFNNLIMSHFAGWFWSFYWIITGYFIVDTWHRKKHAVKGKLLACGEKQNGQTTYSWCLVGVTHASHTPNIN